MMATTTITSMSVNPETRPGRRVRDVFIAHSSAGTGGNSSRDRPARGDPIPESLAVTLRLRRRAQKHGIRPFKLHCTRHTWASMALASGKSVRWVADQLGHASPMLTLQTYAHAMPEEEADLGFADFGESNSPGRPYTAPLLDEGPSNENAPDANRRGRYGILEHETGLEPATPTLATSSVWIPWRSVSVQSRSMAGTCAQFVIPG